MAVIANKGLECDLLVVGSGAGALCAALTGSDAGLNVLVLEKERWFGGASARSGGGLWIPGNKLAERAGIPEDRDKILTYFRHEAGPLFDEDRVTAFLDNGPEMVEFVERNTALKFLLLAGFPDYHPHHPGGSDSGRAISTLATSSKPLGKEYKRLRRPLKVSTFMGMQVGIEDVGSFMTAGRSVKSFLYVTKLVLRLMRDLAFHGRTMRLAMGNALVGGLAASLFQRKVPILTSAPVRSLRTENGRVVGAVAEIDGRMVDINARKGVVLATGGFPHDGKRRAELFPSGAVNPDVWGLMPYGNSGDGLRMGEAVGGYVEDRMEMPVALSPVSRIDVREGDLTCYPVFGSRGGPGLIAVKRNGRRFVDEAGSYHDFGAGLLKASEGEQEAVAFLIADHRAMRRFGLAYAHPFPLPLGKHLRSGYLLRGQTLAELAQKAGIDPATLEETVANYNRNAVNGVDPEFGRGTNAYDIAAGDPEHGPNPCVGPLVKAPFYAVRVVAGSVGTFAGLITNGNAQVLKRDGSPIEGLYAAGNDLSSITGGDYIGGGCTIGPAMTFGYVAARHAAGVA